MKGFLRFIGRTLYEFYVEPFRYGFTGKFIGSVIWLGTIGLIMSPWILFLY